MVTKHAILVQSSRGIQYRFEIHRKYTVIRGDSATGKTTLVHLIEDAVIRKTASLSCDAPCVVLPEINWELNLKAFSNSIVFIDEDHPALTSGKRLAECLLNSDNCFVIISRDKMSWLPYSYQEIYQIKCSGKFHTLERIYENMDTFTENQRYVTEDEAAGLEYFQHWLGSRVSSSYGNSNLSKYASKNTTIIGDGAAIGPYMYDLILSEADLFLPESFEWMLLCSPIFAQNKEVQNLLHHPETEITTNYQSWEEFFTEYIIQITNGKEYQYTKRKINPCYLNQCCFKGTFCDGFTTQEKSNGLADFALGKPKTEPQAAMQGPKAPASPNHFKC